MSTATLENEREEVVAENATEGGKKKRHQYKVSNTKIVAAIAFGVREGWTIEDVANKVGMPVEAVSNRVVQINKRLKAAGKEPLPSLKRRQGQGQGGGRAKMDIDFLDRLVHGEMGDGVLESILNG